MGEEAVSPVIGTVLIMAMMVTIVGTMLAWGIPQVQDNEAWAQYATTRSNLLNLDADLDQVLLRLPSFPRYLGRQLRALPSTTRRWSRLAESAIE